MTYAVTDKSVQDGIPILFFKFVGTLRNYLYTDHPEQQTLAGETYSPVAIASTAIDVGSIVGGQKTISVTVPADDDLAADYGGKLTPEALTLTVYHAYEGDDLSTQYKQKFRGSVVDFAFDNRLFAIEVANFMTTDLNSPMRDVYYGTTCNHALYDARCKVVKAAHTFTATVVSFSDAAITVDDDGVANHDLKTGTAINTRTGEKRLILDNLANVVDIGYPFIDMEVGDTVNLVRGCNHSASTCVTVFDNIENYGGCLYLPSSNPFNNET